MLCGPGDETIVQWANSTREHDVPIVLADATAVIFFIHTGSSAVHSLGAAIGLRVGGVSVLVVTFW